MSLMSAITNTLSSAASVGKALLLSRRPSGGARHGGAIVILGNGPSLRETIDRHLSWLERHELMAVNFAANTPELQRLRPGLYILADGHFFTGAERDPNVELLWRRIRQVGWRMTLFVPARYRREARQLLGESANVTLKYFNLTPVEGLRWVSHIMFRLGLGMPRPRNVMIPAIMTAIREGYGKVYLAGADHSWSRTLWVDDDNHVVSVQPHFYKDNESEHRRVTSEYAGYHLHDILNSLTIAFRSYFQVSDWARSRGVEVINVTPGSMIDAFPRSSPE